METHEAKKISPNFYIMPLASRFGDVFQFWIVEGGSSCTTTREPEKEKIIWLMKWRWDLESIRGHDPPNFILADQNDKDPTNVKRF